MGNSSSSGGRHQEDTVDYGALVPQGVYTGPKDWNQAIVSQLIATRKLAPFYRPLEDYEEAWDDDQILAARKEFPDSTGDHADTTSRADHSSTASSLHVTSKSSHSKRPISGKEFRPEAAIYRGAVECPICFLYYPRNINHSRCCDQAICTECFVQIKRAEPTTTHLVSEPAACPYCVQENFGIVYKPPPWRAGIGSDGYSPLTPGDVPRPSAQPSIPTHKRRQKSYGADSPEVVTIDQIRPDWEAKLAAVRAAVARRANRRIIMRQVGDRLIPVGIGRVQPEEGGEGGESGSGGRRRRNRHPPGELAQYLGMGGQDLEELMLMEAMRLSLIDHEEQQRKEAEERRKKEEEERAAGGQGTSSGTGESSNAAGSSSQNALSSSLIPPSSTATPGSSSNLSLPMTGESGPSRSRTPELSPPINRTPPPFSTMNAALLTSGTASAFLSASAPPPKAETPAVPAPSIGLPASEDRPTATSSLSPPSLAGQPPRPSSTVTSASSSSERDASFLSSATYGTLPSSPESDHAPLLGNGISANLESARKNDVSKFPEPATSSAQ